MVSKTYKEKEDNNYYNIAKKYHLNLKKLMEINNAETPHTTIGHTIILTKETEPGNKYIGIYNKGLGIHSTNAPASIGYSVTHSCIRMNPKSAAELFK